MSNPLHAVATEASSDAPVGRVRKVYTGRQFGEDQVRAMRELRTTGQTYRQIADAFDTAVYTVAAICRRDIYRDVA
jgi:hypothetical protein